METINPRESIIEALDKLVDYYAAEQREAAKEAAVVVNFIRNAHLPGVTVKNVTTRGGRIFAEVTNIARVPGDFPGVMVRSPEALGSIAAITHAAPTRHVNVEIV